MLQVREPVLNKMAWNLIFDQWEQTCFELPPAFNGHFDNLGGHSSKFYSIYIYHRQHTG